MKQNRRAKTFQNNIVTLHKLISNIDKSIEQRNIRGTLLYFYKSQPLIAYKSKHNNLIVLTSGRTPKERRRAMKPYMTLLGNIKIKPSQRFPEIAIRSILAERKNEIDRNPNKKSFTAGLSTDPTKGNALPRHEKTAQRIKNVERRYPSVKKVTQHPTFSPWILPLVTTAEVTISLIALLIVLPWLFSLMPDINIPFPAFNLPNINLPTINLPDWNLPFSMPNLPEWLENIMYWLKKTWPIWFALLMALEASKKNNIDRTPKNNTKLN